MGGVNMRKINSGKGNRLLGALAAVIVFVLCVALASAVSAGPVPNISSALVPGRSAGFGQAGEISRLRMWIPDEPAVSGDVVLPEAPAK
jgi:hypothetical protein